MTQIMNRAATAVLYGFNCSKELVDGMWVAPIAEVKTWLFMGVFNGSFQGDATQNDQAIANQIRTLSNTEWDIVEMDGQLVLVEKAADWEIASDKAYKEIMAKAEVEAQAAYDKIMAEAEIKADAVYNEVMAKTNDEDAADDERGQFMCDAEDKANAAYDKIMEKAEDEAATVVNAIEDAAFAEPDEEEIEDEEDEDEFAAD